MFILVNFLTYFMKFRQFKALADAPKGSKNEKINSYMAVIISFILLVVGCYIILFGSYPTDVQKWAYGLVGITVGYWIQ